MACSRCGVENPEGKKYCGDCGAPLDAEFGAVREYLDARLPDEVRAAIKEQLKDQKVLEIETSYAIASRISDWMKILGVALTLPFLILGLVGVKSYFDVTNVMKESQAAVEKVKKDADETQKQIAVSKATADVVQRDVAGLQERAGRALEDLQRRQKEIDDLSAPIAALATQVQLNSDSVVALKEAQARGEEARAQGTPQELPPIAPPPDSTPVPVATISTPTVPAASCPPVTAGDISGIAVDLLPVVNCGAGRPYGAPLALSLHTMVGTYEQTRAFLASPNAQGSIHFAVALDGRATQFVALQDRAWSDGSLLTGNRWDRVCTSPCTSELRNPNNWIVSITTDDAGNRSTEVTEAQYRTVLEIGRQVLQRYPSIKWLVTPSDLGRAGNPGPRWEQSGRLATLAQQLGLQTLK